MRLIPIALTFLFTLCAFKCNDRTAEAAGGVEKIASIADSKWVLQTLKGNAVSMPEGEEMPWLKLKKEGSALEGYGGCNQMMGSFTLDGDRISFPGLGSTKKYCEASMSVENAFMGALRKTDQFKMDNGTLQFLSEGAELATFRAE